MTDRHTRLVALDIDGTLIAPGAPPDAMPGADLADAVAHLVAAGVVVVLASGRMYPGTESVARHLDLRAPLICQQGACVHRPDGSLAHRYAIDLAIANELVAFADQRGWSFAWFDSVRYLASRPSEQVDHYARVSGVPAEYHTDAHQLGVRPTGIDIISTLADAHDVHRELTVRYGGRVHLLDFPSVTAVHAPEASKGNALALLAHDLGIARADVVAIGDGVNDASMLRWAGRGIAMPHGDRYAKEAADEVLGGSGVEALAPLLHDLARTPH